MKNNIKICLFAIALMTVVSLASSCTVQYRARHPRHDKVIIVGMEKGNIPSDSAGAALTSNPPVNDTTSTNAIKQK